MTLKKQRNSSWSTVPNQTQMKTNIIGYCHYHMATKAKVVDSMEETVVVDMKEEVEVVEANIVVDQEDMTDVTEEEGVEGMEVETVTKTHQE